MTLRIGEGVDLPLEISEIDLAWTAGLFEGEGTVTIARRGRDDTYRLVVTLANTDEQIIDFFHQRWGYWKQPAYGSRPGRKPAWYWTTTGPGAEAFLRTIVPFLRTDRVRRKVIIALEFREHQSRSKRVWSDPSYKPAQRRMYESMKALNQRGDVAA